MIESDTREAAPTTALPDIPVARPMIGEDEIAAVTEVMRSGQLAQGPQVAAFEAEFAETLGLGRACVAVNSGTSGLHLGLLAAGIGPGDEVIVPSFTFAATANAVAATGAIPVFADIEPETFCLDPEAVRAAITPRTAAIMPVHLYGHPADLPALSEIAARHGLALFEDAAQAHDASTDGVPVGTWGRFAVYSFYPTKNMTAGEGGMVACADAELERRLRLLRNQGMERAYHNEIVGFNNRMTDLHAAIGRVQLRKLGGWNAVRRRNAARLTAGLRGVGTPSVRPGNEHVFHQYTIRVGADRDRVAAELAQQHGIRTGLFYPIGVHRLAPFQASVDLPETDLAAAQALSLPVGPHLSDADLDRVIAAVNLVVRGQP